jgi:hypothetical protein
MMPIKCRNRKFKKVFKKVVFQFFSGLTGGGFGASSPIFKPIIQFGLQTFFKRRTKNLHRKTKGNLRFRVKSVGFWRYFSGFRAVALKKD